MKDVDETFVDPKLRTAKKKFDENVSDGIGHISVIVDIVHLISVVSTYLYRNIINVTRVFISAIRTINRDSIFDRKSR